MNVLIQKSDLDYKNGYLNDPSGIIISFQLSNLFDNANSGTFTETLKTPFSTSDDVQTIDGVTTLLKAKLTDKIDTGKLVFRLIGIDYTYNTSLTIDTANVRFVLLSSNDPDNNFTLMSGVFLTYADFQTAVGTGTNGLISEVSTRFKADLNS